MFKKILVSCCLSPVILPFQKMKLCTLRGSGHTNFRSKPQDLHFKKRLSLLVSPFQNKTKKYKFYKINYEPRDFKHFVSGNLTRSALCKLSTDTVHNLMSGLEKFYKSGFRIPCSKTCFFPETVHFPAKL